MFCNLPDLAENESSLYPVFCLGFFWKSRNDALPFWLKKNFFFFFKYQSHMALKYPFDGPFTALKCPFQMAPCPFENLGRTLVSPNVSQRALFVGAGVFCFIWRRFTHAERFSNYLIWLVTVCGWVLCCVNPNRNHNYKHNITSLCCVNTTLTPNIAITITFTPNPLCEISSCKTVIRDPCRLVKYLTCIALKSM